MPVSGYLVHKSHIQKKKNDVIKNRVGNVGPDAIFEIQDNDPVGDGLGALGLLGNALEVKAKFHIAAEDFGVAGGELVIAHEALLAHEGQLDEARADGGDPVVGGLHGHEVRLGEVAVVVGVLLGAHLLGDARDVIPAARGLHELAALGDDFDLPGDLIVGEAPVRRVLARALDAATTSATIASTSTCSRRVSS